MKTISLCLPLILFFVLAAHGQMTITGTLVGSDGKPMLKAHVHLVKLVESYGQLRPIVSVEAAKDGTYKISTDQTGPFILQYTGVHHGQENVLLATGKRFVEKINVKLASYKYSPDFTSVKIKSDVNNFDFRTAQEMTKQQDGTFTAEFDTKADTFRYQLYGIAESRSINGTQSEDFEYDSGGDYRSMVTPKDGRVQIVFDPKKLVRSYAQAEVRFAEPSSSIAKAAAVHKEWMQRIDAVRQTAIEYQFSGKDIKAFTYDASADIKYFSNLYAAERDPLVKRLLLLSQLGVVQFNRPPKLALLENVVTRVVDGVSPTSPLWSIDIGLILNINAAVHNGFSTKEALRQDQKMKCRRYVDEFLERNPDALVKANLVSLMLTYAKRDNDQQAVAKYYDLLMMKFGNTPIAKMAKERFSSKIAVGKTVPQFSLVSMSDPKTSYTNESFKGKIYLIDFWAVWCSPCIGEMEHLHNAYEKFKSKNFDILSLSFDAKPEDVVKFRTHKWKMPWQHVFLEKGFDNPISREFEVIGIPKPILVDGNTGKILAMEGELRGQSLERTLSKFLGEAQ